MKKSKLILITTLLLSSCNVVNNPSESANTNISDSNSNTIEENPSTEPSISIPSENSSSTEPSLAIPSEESLTPSISIESPSISESSSEEEILEVQEIKLDESEISLKCGETYQIKAIVLPENAIDKSLTYKSSNTTVAKVNSSGKITASALGKADITIKANNGVETSIAVTTTLADLPSLKERTLTTSTTPYYGNEYFYSQNLNPTEKTLSDGVILTNYTYAGVDGSNKKVYTVTVDLNKADIEIGTSGNSYFPTSNAILSKQAASYETATNRKVLAAVNGDYFGAYGAGSSNGFCVKDGVVINAKSAFYENLVNGMLALSISYNNVASINKSAPNSSTFYRVDNVIELYNSKSTKVGKFIIDTIDNNLVLDMHQGNSRSKNYEVITKTRSVSNTNVVYVDIEKEYNADDVINFPFDGKITKVSKGFSGTISLNSNQVAILVKDSTSGLLTFDENKNRVRVGVTESDSSNFSGIKTLIGGRHYLIDNYTILSNLSSESTNDAKTKRARTAMGILGDGKVMIFVCEDGSSKGLNLVQVADFMRYHGCKYALNLDGGGSTGLLTRQNDTLSITAGLNTRALANTVLVVKK